MAAKAAHRRLLASAFAVFTPWPAAGSALAFFQLFLGPANRRFRVFSCLASSTQQMNSLRAKGVMSCQAANAVELAINA